MQAPWIKAALSPVVPGTSVHAYALTPLILWIVWWRWWTFSLVVVMTVVMIILQLKGRSPGWVLRKLKCNLRGHTLSARPLWYRRRRTHIESYDGLDLAAAYSMAPAQGVLRAVPKAAAAPDAAASPKQVPSASPGPARRAAP